MSKLLDMEREAEVAAAQEAATQCSTAVAQVRTLFLCPAVLSVGTCLGSCTNIAMLWCGCGFWLGQVVELFVANTGALLVAAAGDATPLL
jgi:hypothetical protein